jgi:hypothetical protein
MGLLYPLPHSEAEAPFFQRKGEKLILRTYGLPYLFWGYFFAALLVLAVMYLLIHAPLLKMFASDDGWNKILALTVWSFFLGLPSICLGFFFYEKRLIKEGQKISVVHRLFYLPVWRKTYQLTSSELTIDHYMGTPNMARLQNEKGSRGFQNHGYFELKAQTDKGEVVLDRDSRRHEMKKIKSILEM